MGVIYSEAQVLTGSYDATNGAIKVENVGNAQGVSSNTTNAQIASSGTVVTLKAANTARKGLTIYNDSTAALTVYHGSGASTTQKTIIIAAGAYYEMPFGYNGIVTGLWASVNGNAYITEFS